MVGCSFRKGISRRMRIERSRGRNGSYCNAVERVSPNRRSIVLCRCFRRARYFTFHSAESRFIFTPPSDYMGKGRACYPLEAFLSPPFCRFQPGKITFARRSQGNTEPGRSTLVRSMMSHRPGILVQCSRLVGMPHA
jgi:hypothetical protein